MYKRYFRMKDPTCCKEDIAWIEMDGKEFYRFIKSPEGRDRHFVDMGNVVLEASPEDARACKTDRDHHYYVQAMKKGWSTLSIYALEEERGCSGEEIIQDETVDVEAEAILRVECESLKKELAHMDEAEYLLIYARYLAKDRKTLRQLSREYGVPVMTLQNREKKTIAWLREKMS